MSVRRTSVGLFSRAIGLRVTVLLLLLVVFATALGALVPMGYDIFRSWWYAGLLALVGLQTALCTVARGRTAVVQAVRPLRFDPGDLGSTSIAVGLAPVLDGARRLGYRPVGPTPPVDGALVDQVVLAKGRLQPLGFLVLHVGLLVLIAGSLWNLDGSSVTSLALNPGERTLDPETGRQFELLAVRPEAHPVGEGGERRWELSGLEADLRVYEGADLLTEGTAGLGSPLDLGEGQVVLLPTVERYQVTLRLDTPDGRQLDARITSDAPEVDLPGSAGLAARVEDFSPDSTVDGGGTWRRDGPLLRAPLAAVALVERETDATRARVDLRPGEALDFDGYSIRFVGADYVPLVVVSRQVGEPVALIGALAVAVGMLLSLAFSFRQLWVRPVDGGVEVSAFARRRHQPLVEELEALADSTAEILR